MTGNADLLPQVAFGDLPPEEQSKWVKEMTHSMLKPWFHFPLSAVPAHQGVAGRCVSRACPCLFRRAKEKQCKGKILTVVVDSIGRIVCSTRHLRALG